MSETITIGELARRTGVSTSTLRYYEQRGLVTADEHDGGGRRYRPDAVHRLHVIHQLQQAGFALAEIVELLEREQDWPGHARRKRAELDARIQGLSRAQELIDAALDCGCAELEGCGAHHDPTARAASRS